MANINNIDSYGRQLNIWMHAEMPSDYDNAFWIGGSMYFNGTKYTGAQIDDALSGSGNGTIIQNAQVTAYSGTTPIVPAGMYAVSAGTGDYTSIEAPIPNGVCSINLAAITSGIFRVTCPTGVTFDGVNSIADFNAVNDELVLGYKSPTQFAVYSNNSVTLHN